MIDVTIPRLSILFGELGLEHTVIGTAETEMLQTGIPHVTIFGDIEDGTLSLLGSWEARIPASAEDEVIAAVGDFNAEVLVPALHYIVDEEDQIVISATRAMGVAEGLDDAQLAAFLFSSFASFDAAFAALADRFPQHADWEVEAAEEVSDEEDFVPVLPAVTLERVIAELAEDDIAAAADSPGLATAHFNEVDWEFSVDPGLLVVECILPTELGFDDSSAFLRTVANDKNSVAADGCCAVRDVDGNVELRGRASAVVAEGMTDEQLFHVLNYAIVAAQDALLDTLDSFNRRVREL